MNSKPVIFFVDDEPSNLVVFEAALPEEWEILTFDSPIKALDKLEDLKPWVVVSDQRMPEMVGVRLLELVKKIHPQAKRVLVTGYSDEDLVVESVRSAQVCDYIRKPWDAGDLEVRLQKTIESYQLEEELRHQQQVLQDQNEKLKQQTQQLEIAKESEYSLRKELSSWVPPVVLTAIQNQVQFPVRQDLAVITYDIVNSSLLHDEYVEGRKVRGHILRIFSELILKYGGWRESIAGDSAFAHFGLLDEFNNPCDAALAVATEFRVALRNFCKKHALSIECGVGLHLAQGCLVEVHEVECVRGDQTVVQKSFDSTSSGVDLVHRMEKLTHELAGSNIIMSEDFYTKLSQVPEGTIELGGKQFRGQTAAKVFYLKKSDQIQDEELNAFVSGNFVSVAIEKAS